MLNNQGALFEKPKKILSTGKKKKHEERIQLQVCNYLKLQYPHVIFTCDVASGLHLPIFLGALHKRMRSSRGIPDLFIAHPGKWNNVANKYSFNGLFIELKKDKSEIYLVDGSTLKKAKKQIKKGKIVVEEYDHIDEQNKILNRLKLAGYAACFACGFDEAKKIIDEYLC
jgi:hypothetical protein